MGFVVVDRFQCTFVASDNWRLRRRTDFGGIFRRERFRPHRNGDAAGAEDDRSGEGGKKDAEVGAFHWMGFLGGTRLVVRLRFALTFRPELLIFGPIFE